MSAAKTVAEFESLSVPLKPKGTRYEQERGELTENSRRLLTRAGLFRAPELTTAQLTARDRHARRRKPKPPPADAILLSDVRCEQRLGGLLRHYYRKAA